MLGERQIRIYHPHPAHCLATARCAGQGEGTFESAVRLNHRPTILCASSASRRSLRLNRTGPLLCAMGPTTRRRVRGDAEMRRPAVSAGAGSGDLRSAWVRGPETYAQRALRAFRTVTIKARPGDVGPAISRDRWRRQHDPTSSKDGVAGAPTCLSGSHGPVD